MRFAKICKESYNWFPSIQCEISLLNRFWSAIIFSEGTFVLAQLSLTPWIRSSAQIEKHPFFKEVEPEAPTQYFQHYELLSHDVDCKHIPVRCEVLMHTDANQSYVSSFLSYLIYCTLITHILHQYCWDLALLVNTRVSLRVSPPACRIIICIQARTSYATWSSVNFYLIIHFTGKLNFSRTPWR